MAQHTRTQSNTHTNTHTCAPSAATLTAPRSESRAACQRAHRFTQQHHTTAQATNTLAIVNTNKQTTQKPYACLFATFECQPFNSRLRHRRPLERDTGEEWMRTGVAHLRGTHHKASVWAPVGRKRPVLARAGPSTLSGTKCGARRGAASKGAGDGGSRVSSTSGAQTTLPAPGEATNAATKRPPGDQPRLPPEQQHHPGASPIRAASLLPSTSKLAPCATPPTPDRPPPSPPPPAWRST